MRSSVLLAFATLALAACVLALPHPGVFADAERTADEVLAHSRDRYAGARELFARFEGYSAIVKAGAREEVPIRGLIAFRAPDASRYEIRFGEDGHGVSTLREGDRLRRWKLFDADKTELLEDSKIEGPVEVPLLPAFDVYDRSTVKIVDHRRVKDQPVVHVLWARFKVPGDPFVAARLGIEDGTWTIRTLDLLDATGETLMALRFRNVLIDEAIPPGTFSPPPSR